MAATSLVFTSYLVMTTCSYVYGQQCLFGPGCRFACNCDSKCDPETGCTARRCARGWGGRTCQMENVALNRSTTQSSTSASSSYGSGESHAAVDGSTGYCSVTNYETRPSWTVTLDRAYNIYRFLIYAPYDFTLCSPVKQSPVSFCSPGTYGTSCTKTCGFCADGCDVISGRCPDRQPRCMAGYSGQNCTTACTSGQYGPDCAMKCGFCYDGPDVCDSISGNCPVREPRCMAGYSGPKCDEECTPGAYGVQCQQRCGHCVDGNLTCDHVTGGCDNCAAGWQGDHCTQSCSQGTWGPNCKLTCSANCVRGRTECDILNGQCFGGCIEGYEGATCEHEQTSGNVGVIVGSIFGAILGSALVTAACLLWKKRQSASQSVSTPADLGTPKTSQPVVDSPKSTSDPAVYYNTAVDAENTYEDVNPNYYNKIEFSSKEGERTYSSLT